MSTGAFHYTEAENLLRIASQTERTDLAADCQRDALVHATLALAAATVQAGGLVKGGTVPTEWHKALHGGAP